MNIVLAQTFLEIVSSGNFNKAADRLHVTQSTVTMRINALEDILGQKLLIRNRAGVELTTTGSKFRRYAEMLVQIWHQARQEIALPSDFEAVFNIGIDPHLWEGPGRHWLLWMRRELPQIALSVRVGDSHALLHWLSQGLLDFALEYNPQARPGLRVDKLFDDRLVVASTVPREPVRWHPLYVYVDWGEDFRKTHSATFPDEETPGVTIAHGDWALRFIYDYGGSGYFPLRQIETELAEGRLHIVRSPEFRRTVYAVYFERTLQIEWFRKAFEGLRALCEPYALASGPDAAPGKRAARRPRRRRKEARVRQV